MGKPAWYIESWHRAADKAPCSCGHPLFEHCGQEGMCATQRDLCSCFGWEPPPVQSELARCVHVFIGPLDVCLACGTPNPASLR